jgi:hypothetical protein
VLQDLINRLPDGARGAVQEVIDRIDQESRSGGGGGSTVAPPENPSTGGNAEGASAPTDASELDAPGQASPPAPWRTPRPERTPNPAPEVEPGRPVHDGSEDDAGD